MGRPSPHRDFAAEAASEQPCYVRLAKPSDGPVRGVPSLCVEIMHPVSGVLLMQVEMGGRRAWRSLVTGSREQATIRRFAEDHEGSL